MLRRGVHADTGSWNERARYTSGFVYRVYSSECSLILLCDLSSVFYADPCHSTRCFLYAFTRESDINFLSGFDSIFDVFIPTGTSLFKVTRCILDYKPNAFITIEPFNSYKTVFFFLFFSRTSFIPIAMFSSKTLYCRNHFDRHYLSNIVSLFVIFLLKQSVGFDR